MTDWKDKALERHARAVWESADRCRWSELSVTEKRAVRDEARAALKELGFFDLVEAGSEVVADHFERDESGDPWPNLDRLRSALAKAKGEG